MYSYVNVCASPWRMSINQTVSRCTGRTSRLSFGRKEFQIKWEEGQFCSFKTLRQTLTSFWVSDVTETKKNHKQSHLNLKLSDALCYQQVKTKAVIVAELKDCCLTFSILIRPSSLMWWWSGGDRQYYYYKRWHHAAFSSHRSIAFFKLTCETLTLSFLNSYAKSKQN